MKPLDACPRCLGTLLIDEWGALRCLLCCRVQPGGQDRDTGGPSYVSPTSAEKFGRSSTTGYRVINPISEEIEAGA
jgi:hypothetical protein